MINRYLCAIWSHNYPLNRENMLFLPCIFCLRYSAQIWLILVPANHIAISLISAGKKSHVLKIHLVAARATDCGFINRHEPISYRQTITHIHTVQPMTDLSKSKTIPKIHTRVKPNAQKIAAQKKTNCEMNAIKRTFVLILARGLIYILIRSWHRDYWWHPILSKWLMFGTTANVISVTLQWIIFPTTTEAM